MRWMFLVVALVAATPVKSETWSEMMQRWRQEDRDRYAESRRDREHFSRESSEFMRSLEAADTRRELRALRRSVDDLNSTIESSDRRRSE